MGSWVRAGGGTDGAAVFRTRIIAAAADAKASRSTKPRPKRIAFFQPFRFYENVNFSTISTETVNAPLISPPLSKATDEDPAIA
jgi:hypothetical protein